jgi:hypothetical protein
MRCGLWRNGKGNGRARVFLRLEAPCPVLEVAVEAVCFSPASKFPQPESRVISSALSLPPCLLRLLRLAIRALPVVVEVVAGLLWKRLSARCVARAWWLKKRRWQGMQSGWESEWRMWERRARRVGKVRVHGVQVVWGGILRGFDFWRGSCGERDIELI